MDILSGFKCNNCVAERFIYVKSLNLQSEKKRHPEWTHIFALYIWRKHDSRFSSLILTRPLVSRGSPLMPSSRESFHDVISVTLRPRSPDARLDTERWLHQAVSSCYCCQKLCQAAESTVEQKRVRIVFPCKFFFKLCLVSQRDSLYVSDQV